ALMNSRLGTAFLRALVSGLNFNPGYCKLMPLPAGLARRPRELERIAEAVDACGALVARPDRSGPTAPTLAVPGRGDGHGPAGSLEAYADACEQQSLDDSLALLLIEGELERLVADEYGLSSADARAIGAELGIPAAHYPLVVGLDELPERIGAHV